MASQTHTPVPPVAPTSASPLWYGINPPKRLGALWLRKTLSRGVRACEFWLIAQRLIATGFALAFSVSSVRPRRRSWRKLQMATRSCSSGRDAGRSWHSIPASGLAVGSEEPSPSLRVAASGLPRAAHHRLRRISRARMLIDLILPPSARASTLKALRRTPHLQTEPVAVGAGDVLLALGHFSSDLDEFRLEGAVHRGARLVLVAYDLIPMTRPRFCVVEAPHHFPPLTARAVVLTDVLLPILTTSVRSSRLSLNRPGFSGGLWSPVRRSPGWCWSDGTWPRIRVG